MLYNLYILLHVVGANMDVGLCVQVLSVSKLNRVSRRSAGRVVNSVHVCGCLTSGGQTVLMLLSLGQHSF